MKKKWIGINLLLLAGTVAAAWKLNDSVQQYSAQNDLAAIQPAEPREVESVLPPPPVFQTQNPMNFADIVDKNVFSETRSKGEAPAAASPTGNMPAAQKPTLVGVVITDNQRVASLLAPTSARGRNAPAQQVQLKRVGEAYEGGYTVAAIEPDHIELDNGRQKQILYLNDTSEPARRRQTAAVTTRVVPIGGGTATAASTTPISVLSNNINTLQQLIQNRLTRQPTNGSAAGNAGQPGNPGMLITPVMPNLGGTTTPTTPPLPSVIQQTTQPPGSTSGGTQGGSRVIRTPFGDVIRNQ